MCGIFALLNTDKNDIRDDVIKEQFLKGKRRGPENSKLEFSYLKMILGFHRLAINGLNPESNQPLVYDDVVLICNGEIYNYKQLYKFMNIKPTTDSDCEVIIHLFIRYGIEQTLIMLDGVFAFVLYDNRTCSNPDFVNRIYVARDPIGIRPLYKIYSTRFKYFNLYGFASEMKCLEYFYNSNIKYFQIQQFEPGTYSMFDMNESKWEIKIQNKIYFTPTFSYTRLRNFKDICDEIFMSLSSSLNSAVIKRCNTTERPVACLLSGGLDSSLIAALVSNFFREKGQQIETYSIGLADSEDIKYARIVANYIGSNHTEIILSESDMFFSIPEVIEAIESYDTTTVRASVGNYLISLYVKENSQDTVLFCGDVSDEIFGSYRGFYYAKSNEDFFNENMNMIHNIQYFDVLRSDKSIAGAGLEARVPFSDGDFLKYCMSIHPSLKRFNKDHIEKYLFRKAFEDILPKELAWRVKTAFSDGVSNSEKPWYEIIKEYMDLKYTEDEYKEKILKYKHNTPYDKESLYYREIYEKFYPNTEKTIPYFWKQPFTKEEDPSAWCIEKKN
jgi:asparagine synthase (glutamine-hydrolysing)